MPHLPPLSNPSPVRPAQTSLIQLASPYKADHLFIFKLTMLSLFPLTEHTMIEWNNEGLHTPSTELTSLMCWICIDWFNFALCFTLAIEVVFILFIFFFSWHKYILEKTNREKTAYQRAACTYENQDAHINTHNIKKIQTKGSFLFVCFFTLMLLQHHGKVVIK